MPRGKSKRKGAAIEPPFSIPATEGNQMEPAKESVNPVMEAAPLPPPPPPKPVGPKMHTVKVLRNIQPIGDYEIVGFHKEAVVRKDTTGRLVEISKAEFVSGEGAPPPYAGVGFKNKIWAGTVIKLNDEETKRFKQAKAVELEID